MNETKPQPGAGSAAVSALEARIERTRAALAAQQARLARGSRLTAIIGTALVVLMAVYFGIFYRLLQGVMTPEKIVAAAEDMVLKQLPEARKALERKVNDSAGEWAGELSIRVQDNIPYVRGQIEDVIMKKAGEALDELHVLSGQRFREFVNENHTMLAEGFASLRKREDAEQFVTDLHTAISRNLAGDMREQADDMLHTMYELNHKIEVLKDGKNLKGEQPLEREILMIAKRLQRDSALDPDPDPDKPERKGKKMRTARPGEEAGGTDEPAASAKPTEEPASEPKGDAKDDKPVEKDKKSGDN